MPVTALPAGSYAEALPYLRAPYTPSVIRFRIQAVPDHANSPCVVVLFVNSETVMDRFNIVCGPEWTPPEFTVLVHREESGSDNKPIHYLKVRATFSVYGRPFTDTSEATDKSEVQAEFNANARAFKRAARWPGPGQSLYQPCAIKMFRGAGPERLRTWSDDLRKPHIDQESERFLIGHYEKVLAEKIIPIYGEPFDHLLAVTSNAARHQPSVPGVAPRAQAASTAGQQLATGAKDVLMQAAAPAARGRPAASKDTTAIRETAQNAGYTDALSEALMGLAREDDDGGLSAAHAECVEGWIAVLGTRQIEESKILEAVTFALENCASRHGAQLKFGQWVAAKARAAPQEPSSIPSDGNGSAQEQPGAIASSEVTPDISDPQVETAAAMRELQDTIARHDYSERGAARIAALAIGADPDRKIDLAKVPPATLRNVSELLDAAATLQWSTGTLDDEISRAHNSTQQGTSASRFGAFATHLMNSAEARAEETARAADAAGATT